MSVSTRSEPMSATESLHLNRDAAPSELGLEAGFGRQLLNALIAFRDGDFKSRLPNDLVGVSGKIADVFNEILAVSARRADETTRICRVVGKEGRLRQRITVPGITGGWSDEIKAINTLIDD